MGQPGEELDVLLVCAKCHGNCHGLDIIVFDETVKLEDMMNGLKPGPVLVNLFRTKISKVIFIGENKMVKQIKKGRFYGGNILSYDTYYIVPLGEKDENVWDD